MAKVGTLQVRVVPNAENFQKAVGTIMAATGAAAAAEGRKVGKSFGDGMGEGVAEGGLAPAIEQAFVTAVSGSGRHGRSAGKSFGSGLTGETGRATRDVESQFQQMAKALAFNGGPASGLTSTLGLMGGQAAVAGGAIAGVSIAAVGLAASLAAVGAGAAVFGKLSAAALENAGTLQQQRIALNTLMGSAEKGGEMFKSLIQFSQSTPFELQGTMDAAKRLMAMGFAAEEVLPMLTRLGNASSSLGLGTEGFNRLALVMGQIKSKAQLMTQDVNQFAEAGIPVWDILAQKMGKTRGEVMDLTEDGLVPASDALEAIQGYMDMKFSGAMEEQSKTLLGVFTNLKESLSVGFGLSMQKDLDDIAASAVTLGATLGVVSASLGSGLGTTLTTYFEDASAAIDNLVTDIGTLGANLMTTWTPTMGTLTQSLSDAFTNALPGIEAMSSAFSTMIGWISSALPGLGDQFTAFGDTVYKIVDTVDALGSAIGGLMDSMGSGSGSVVGFVEQMYSTLFPTLTDLIGMLSAAAMLWAKLTGNEELELKLNADAFKQGLPVEVRLLLDQAHSQLSNLYASIEGNEVLARVGIEPKALASADPAELRKILALPDEVLVKAGLQDSNIKQQAATLLSFIEGSKPEMKALLKLDDTEAQNAVPAKAAELQRKWLQAVEGGKDAQLKILADAGQANTTIAGVEQRVMIYSATTGRATLLADATDAEQKTAFAEGRVFSFDSKTGKATLLTEDLASASVESARQAVVSFDATKGTAVVTAEDVEARRAINDVRAALAELDAAKATGNIDAIDNATVKVNNAMAVFREVDGATATTRVNSVDESTPVVDNARARVNDTDGTAATTYVRGMDESTHVMNSASVVVRSIDGQSATTTVQGRDNATPTLNLTIGNFARADGTRSTFYIDVIQRTSGGAGIGGTANVGAGPGGSPFSLGGAADTVYAASRASSPKPVASGAAGVWLPNLQAIIAEINRSGRVLASSMDAALRRVYVTERDALRRIDDARTKFARAQEVEATANERFWQAQRDSRGDAFVADRIREFRWFQEEQRKVFDRQLEDQQSYYDAQKALADDFVARLRTLQEAAARTINWDDFTNPASLTRSLERTSAILSGYASDLAALQQRGLSEQVQGMLEQMDPLNAAKLAKRLLADPASIRTLNGAYEEFIASGIRLSGQQATPLAAVPGMVGATSAARVTAAPPAAVAGVVVNQTINPSAGMSERDLAAAVSRELLWQL